MFVLITPDENASRHRRVKLAFDYGITGESQAQFKPKTPAELLKRTRTRRRAALHLPFYLS